MIKDGLNANRKQYVFVLVFQSGLSSILAGPLIGWAAKRPG